MRQNLLRSLARTPATAKANASHTARTFATSARRQAEVELTVDGKKVSVEGIDITKDTQMAENIQY